MPENSDGMIQPLGFSLAGLMGAIASPIMSPMLGAVLGSSGAPTVTARDEVISLRNGWCNNNSGGLKQAMVVHADTWAASAPGSYVGFANFYIDAGLFAEIGNAAAMDVQCSLEYPLGSALRQYSWSAYPNAGHPGDPLWGSIPAGVGYPGDATSAAAACSDTLVGAVVAGENYKLHYFFNNANGMIYRSDGRDAAAGDILEIGVTATNRCAPGSGNPTHNTAAGYCLPPAAVFGVSTTPSWGIWGDSIGYGEYDGSFPTSLRHGFARSMPALRGGINYSTSGLKASQCDPTNLGLFRCPGRFVFAQKQSRSLIQVGVNDVLIDGVAASVVSTRRQALMAALPAYQLKYPTTFAPTSSSGDQWATTGGQTAANQPVWGNFNVLVRAGLPGATNYCEVASALGTTTTSDIWKVTGVAYGYVSTDNLGLHPNTAGYDLLNSSGAITAAFFT